MIKGVNRQVLEIKDTGCEYFTQALFFVDPKFSTLPEKTLREKAEASLKDPPGVPVSKKQKALKIILKITNIAAAARSSTMAFLSRGRNCAATSRWTRQTSSALQTEGRLALALTMMLTAFARSAALST